MKKPHVLILKIGGQVIDDEAALDRFLNAFAQIQGPKILIHGGGKLASQLGEKLALEVKMHEGRRITDADTLDVVTMVYAGLINKKIVAKLQSINVNAIGLSGADANLIQAKKRADKPINFGFVGNLTPNSVSAKGFQQLLDQGLYPVCSAITHDGQGQLLNTNADTIAAHIAIALSESFQTSLLYCFEKKGVLKDLDNPDSLITSLNQENYQEYKNQGIIAGGMLPKLDNAFAAIQKGVTAVYIGQADDLTHFNSGNFGTKITA